VRLARALHERALPELAFVSMSRPGMPYDNAMAESFFGTLKLGLIPEKAFVSRTEPQDGKAPAIGRITTGSTRPAFYLACPAREGACLVQFRLHDDGFGLINQTEYTK
jgi:transposase InsO family protein